MLGHTLASNPSPSWPVTPQGGSFSRTLQRGPQQGVGGSTEALIIAAKKNPECDELREKLNKGVGFLKEWVEKLDRARSWLDYYDGIPRSEWGEDIPHMYRYTVDHMQLAEQQVRSWAATNETTAAKLAECETNADAKHAAEDARNEFHNFNSLAALGADIAGFLGAALGLVRALGRLAF